MGYIRVFDYPGLLQFDANRVINAISFGSPNGIRYELSSESTVI